MSWAHTEWIIIILYLRFSVLQGILFIIKIICRQPTFMQEDLKQPFNLKQSLSVLEGSKDKLNSVIKPAIYSIVCVSFSVGSFLSLLRRHLISWQIVCCLELENYLTVHYIGSNFLPSFKALWPTSHAAVSSVAKLGEAVVRLSIFSTHTL